MIKRLNLKDNTIPERFLNGVVKENPLFVLMLGLCPALAVTTSALNGIGMGLATLFVLVFSNLCISLLRNSIPDKIRLLVYIIIIALFVTITEVIIKAYLPTLDKALGIYLPLIVVNCVIMSRVESYAVKNKVLLSVFDAAGMGFGFTLALMIIGALREFIGTGELFSLRVMPESYPGVTIFVLAPGAFFMMAFLAAIHKKVKANLELKAGRVESQKAESEKVFQGVDESEALKKDKDELLKGVGESEILKNGKEVNEVSEKKKNIKERIKKNRFIKEEMKEKFIEEKKNKDEVIKAEKIKEKRVKKEKVKKVEDNKEEKEPGVKNHDDN